MRSRRLGALGDIAVLERELGEVVYRAARGDPSLIERQEQLMRLLDQAHARLEAMRGKEEER